MTSVPDPEGSETELPLNDQQRALEGCIGRLPGRVGQCGRNAFRHLRRAWALHGIDDDMAAFRAITAEEEAASALLRSLQDKRYPGAEALNFRDHVHKVAAMQFILAVVKVLKVGERLHPAYVLEHGASPPRIRLRLDLHASGMAPEPLWAMPDQPLNFVISRQSGPGQWSVETFAEELQALVAGRGFAKFASLVEKEANFRNEILYASDTGVPRLEIERGFILQRLRRVTALLLLTIAVSQSPSHQLLAAQCVQAFIDVLPRLRRQTTAPFDFGPMMEKAHGKWSPGLLVSFAEDAGRWRVAKSWGATFTVRYSPALWLVYWRAPAAGYEPADSG